MAKLSAVVLVLALGLVSTVSARHLLFNVGETTRWIQMHIQSSQLPTQHADSGLYCVTCF